MRYDLTNIENTVPAKYPVKYDRSIFILPLCLVARQKIFKEAISIDMIVANRTLCLTLNLYSDNFQGVNILLIYTIYG